jgi:hypothetical protein
MIDWLERLVSKVAPISTWALFGAGIALSIMLGLMVLLLWLGGWSFASEHERLEYIGVIAILLAIDLAVVIAALAKARVSGHGPGGVGFDINSAGLDGPAPQPAVTVTTEVNKK